MSRRSHTTIILQVEIPVPAGSTQKKTLEWVEAVLKGKLPPEGLANYHSQQTLVKQTGSKSTFL